MYILNKNKIYIIIESDEANINSIELVIGHRFPEESVAIVSINEIMRPKYTSSKRK